MCMQWMVMMATILSPAVPKASPALTRALSIVVWFRCKKIFVRLQFHYHSYSWVKGLASQCKAQEKYKERLDLGLTWLKWLPTGMESKTRLAPRSNKVNSQKLTLDWNTSLCYRVIWKWRQSAFHANNHAIGGGSNGIIHLGWRPHTFLLHTNIDSTNSNTNRTNITEMAFKRFAVEIRLLLLKKCSHWKRWSTITSTGRTD